MEVCSHKEEF